LRSENFGVSTTRDEDLCAKAFRGLLNASHEWGDLCVVCGELTPQNATSAVDLCPKRSPQLADLTEFIR
jgi:hypothetical protein